MRLPRCFHYLAIAVVIGVAIAFTIAARSVIAQTDTTQTKRHFKIERPADLTTADSLTIYDKIAEKMARGYAASGDATATRYPKWRRYNSAPYRSATHGNRYVNNYGNAKAADYGKMKKGDRLPEGAIIAKDSFTVTSDGDVFGGALFIMEKLALGAKPEFADWRYVMIMPDGSLFGDSAGDNTDKVDFCNSCHSAAAKTDNLYFIPKKYRRKFLLDN